MNSTLLEQYLKRLRLPTVARNYQRLAKDAFSGANRIDIPVQIEYRFRTKANSDSGQCE